MTSYRLKHVASITISNVDKTSTDDEQHIQLCNYTDVYYNERITPDLHFMKATATSDQVNRFALQSGDVLITKDSETADDIAVPAYVTTDLRTVLCGYHLAMLRPNPNIDGRYLFWVLASRVSREQMTAAATGVTRFGLRYESIGDLRLPLPSLSRQRLIAAYLDVETTRIDMLIAKKKRMIELFDTRFWAAVAALYEFSGVPMMPLSRGSTSWRDGPFGSSLTSSHYKESGARVVRLGNLGRGVFHDENKAFIASEYFSKLRQHEVRAGDLLVAGLGDENNPLGRACVAPELGDAIVKADCFRFRLDETRLLPSYTAWYLSSPRGTAASAEIARGSTRMRANLGMIAHICVPYIPIAQQRHLISKIEYEHERLSGIRRILTSQNDLLREHRDALITAAVTGDFDIPGIAA